ncbi:Copper(I)-binding protein [Devosia enhydra]|uniref:Copper(I)-binding protein n=1 Tax=Devosia enhydra TaxID=665118 RepID=A0A1K2I1R4_9HYPH|nr:copper uptake system-associated protein [Devosia enhydra]SFZ86272.1 Copper(I)-binding protein [Devosia enhydra]
MLFRPLLAGLAGLALLSTAVMAQDAAHHGAAHTQADAPTISGEVKLGDIAISGAFSRATLPNAPVGGGFLTIANTGTLDDRLVSASADVGRETQIHEMAVVNDVMRMRQLDGGIPVAAGETVTLSPGGLHLMFMGLNGPLVEGESFPVTLTFEKAGSITIDMSIAGSAAREGAMDHGAHGGAHGAGHGSASPLDQRGLSDVDAIAAMQKALFETPGNPLEMGPIVVSGDYAISGWTQNGAGGRALLRKTARGWGIHLCAGDGLKDVDNLISIGVPEDAARALVAALAVEEGKLSPATVALYDAFDGTVMVDEDLI